MQWDLLQPTTEMVISTVDLPMHRVLIAQRTDQMDLEKDLHMVQTTTNNMTPATHIKRRHTEVHQQEPRCLVNPLSEMFKPVETPESRIHHISHNRAPEYRRTSDHIFEHHLLFFKSYCSPATDVKSGGFHFCSHSTLANTNGGVFYILLFTHNISFVTTILLLNEHLPTLGDRFAWMMKRQCSLL